MAGEERAFILFAFQDILLKLREITENSFAFRPG
jgi:hypothetical protein